VSRDAKQARQSTKDAAQGAREDILEYLSNLEIVCTACEKYGVAERVDERRDVKVHFDVGKAQNSEY
jgi:hypothetical protein